MKHIVIATDGARLAVDQWLGLASELGARVTFVAVSQPPLPICGDPYWQRAVSSELGRLRPAVSEAIEQAGTRGVDAD